MKPVGGHYVKPNHAARVPRRHICIDTESRHVTDGKSDVQTWLLGHAVFTEHTPAGVWRRKSVPYKDETALWRDITAYTRSRRRTVVWAHNLSYDLRTSRALQAMAMLGWKLMDIRISNQGTWVRWNSGDRTLLAVDSFSVWPVKLETLGSAVGVPKMVKPPSGEISLLADYCQRDAEILATAVEQYITWLREDDVGNWQLTGAGQAWANWRHRHMTHSILVSDQLNARALERRAMWTGRTEAYSYGHNDSEKVYDWDWQNSYPRICRDVGLPVAQHSVSRKVAIPTLLKWTDKYAILAEVSVRTSVPCVPTEHDGRILWPTGDFDTVLWDPELRLLHENGAHVKVGRIVVYRRAPALRVWAESIMGDLHRVSPETPAWRKIILKNWSRALIGRFAMRYRQWEDFAVSEIEDLVTLDGWDWERNEPVSFLQIGKDVRILAGEQDGEDCAPFVTGYVMSEARARLWRVLGMVGWENVLYVDTDSLLVNSTGNARLNDLAGRPEVDGLRLKRRFTGWSIAGPRQLVLGDEVRVSGIPRNARRTGPWTFEGEVWRGMKSSLRHGEHSAVRVTSRTFRVMGTDHRRAHDGKGRTTPISLPRPFDS